MHTACMPLWRALVMLDKALEVMGGLHDLLCNFNMHTVFSWVIAEEPRATGISAVHGRISTACRHGAGAGGP